MPQADPKHLETIRVFARAAAGACARALGARATGVQPFPALPGRMRESVRVTLGARSAIATRRAHGGAREAEVLRALHAANAPVPAVLSYRDGWLIQEDLGPDLLSVALHARPAADGETLLGHALDSLAELHAAARRADLAAELFRPRPGVINAAFHAALPAQPARLAHALGLQAPALDEARLSQALRPGAWCFCKWDASPGNAALRGGGSVAWFDWAVFGGRSALDDVAWLMASEHVPDWPAAEARVLRSRLDAFEPPSAERERYLAVFGTLMMCWRLTWYLRLKGTGPWWDERRCRAGDVPAPTRGGMARLATRARRWSARTPETAPLDGLLEAVVEAVSR